MKELCSVGDRIVCQMHYPHKYKVGLKITNDVQCAEANKILLSEQDGWSVEKEIKNSSETVKKPR